MQAVFDGERMLETLSAMQTYQQIAFGAACCERMLPSYEMFRQEAAWGDIRPLRLALNAVWSACEGAGTEESELRDLLMRCEQCAPESEDFDSLYTSPAQNATFAICNLLEFLLDSDLDHVVSVPRFSTDSVDLIVQERENMDPRDPSREQKIIEYPLMQQELLRQQRDLADIAGPDAGDGPALVTVRMRARGESILMLE